MLVQLHALFSPLEETACSGKMYTCFADGEPVKDPSVTTIALLQYLALGDTHAQIYKKTALSSQKLLTMFDSKM